MFIFFAWVLWIGIVLNVFVDNFRRTDHHGMAKAMWAVFIILVPFVGVFFYIVYRPREVPTV